MKKYIVCFPLIIILPILIKAQQSEWKVYDTTNSELTTNQVQTVYIDQNDVKWFGTADGLVRFDNTTWTRFDTATSILPSMYITDIETDGNNGIWVGTDNGLVHFDGVNWELFTNANSIFKSNNIVDIYFDKFGFAWFCTDIGVVKYYDGAWTLYDSSTSYLGIDFTLSAAVDLNGIIWIGTFNHDNFNGYLWNYDGTDWEYFRLADHGYTSSFPSALVVDSNNILWLGLKGTNGGAVVKIEQNNWTIYNKSNSEFPGGGINSITLEGESKWIAGGSGVINFNGGQWSVFNHNNSGLPDDFTMKIAVDKFGNKWIATIGGGVAVYKQGGIVTSVENETDISGYILYDNYPNPFNPVTVIRYQVPIEDHVSLKIYNILGREVAILVDEIKQAGNYYYQFSIFDYQLASGVYFYRIQTSGFVQTKKLILLK